MVDAEASPEHGKPASPRDAAAWGCIAADGRLDEYPPGVVVLAMRAIPIEAGSKIRQDLALYLSDVVMRILRKKVRTSYPDGGREIIDEAHFKIMERFLDPLSADGTAFGEHFDARVHFRFIDAVRRYQKRRQVELPPLVDEKGADEEHADATAQADFGSLEVGHALSLIKDPKKRLAFTLTMANHPKGEIAKLLEIDPKTLFLWIKEVREFLKTALKL